MTITETERPGDEREREATPTAWGALLVLCGAIFLEGIDVAMMNVALPSIRRDLGLSSATLSGVVSAYVLGYGGFMLLGGRAADRLGRRRMFLLWMAVFLVFSGLGGLATDGWMLLVARFMTGVSAAFAAPAGLSLVTTSFEEGPQRDRALMVYAGVAAGGFSLGLVAGGLLTTIGWRWVFFAPVILATVILAAAVVVVRETAPPDRRPGTRGGFDLAGAFTITSAMLLLAYGVVRLESPGEGLALTLTALTGGLLLLASFAAIERRASDPLVRPGIFRSGPLVRTNVAALLFLGAFAGFQFLVTLYLQELRSWSTLETGLAMLVIGIDAVLAPTLTPRLTQRFGNLRVLFGGLLLSVVAYAAFLPVGLGWSYWLMLPSFLALGLSFSLAYGPLTVAATQGIAEEDHGLAGGLLYTAIQFGTALGVSAVTAVAAYAGPLEIDSIQTALLVPFGVAVAGAITIATGLRQAPLTTTATVPEDVQ